MAHCVARILDEAADAGAVDVVDRVLLQDNPASPPPRPAHGEQQLSGGRQLRFVWQVWRSLRRRRHDLVFFDQLGPARSVHLPLPGFPPRRYAIFCHGIELGRVEGGQRSRALRGAWRLLTNSERTAEWVRQIDPVLADRVRVTPLCIDPRRIAAWDRAAPAGAPRDRPAAIIVGRMWSAERGKGHDALIEGWAGVRQRVPGAELWIVGSGDDVARLEAKARELAPGAIRFEGQVTDAELGKLYREAALFVMPSRQEGFGLVYAEAMWHGLPCIGSTRDAAGEVIQEGENGVLVPYGDVPAITAAVCDLLSDPERRVRMGESARCRARERFGYRSFRSAVLAALEIPLLAG